MGGVGSLGGAQSGAWRMCALGINVLRISTAQLEALAGVAVDALQAALNSFLAASPHQVVQDIQRGKLPGPGEVRAVGGGSAAAAADGGAAAARLGSEDGSSLGSADGSGPSGSGAQLLLHDWQLADRAVQEAADTGAIRVRARSVEREPPPP